MCPLVEPEPLAGLGVVGIDVCLPHSAPIDPFVDLEPAGCDPILVDAGLDQRGPDRLRTRSQVVPDCAGFVIACLDLELQSRTVRVAADLARPGDRDDASLSRPAGRGRRLVLRRRVVAAVVQTAGYCSREGCACRNEHLSASHAPVYPGRDN